MFRQNELGVFDLPGALGRFFSAGKNGADFANDRSLKREMYVSKRQEEVLTQRRGGAEAQSVLRHSVAFFLFYKSLSHMLVRRDSLHRSKVKRGQTRQEFNLPSVPRHSVSFFLFPPVSPLKPASG